MTFHFPIKLIKGSNSAMITALSVNQLPTAGINCDCAYILTDQVANQMPGLYLHDGLAWRFALDKTQLDSCVIFGRAIELYYGLEQDVEIAVPALIFRNSLVIPGTTLQDGSSAVFAVVLLSGGVSSGVVTFNMRSGAVVLESGDVVTALGYTPVNPAAAVLTGTPMAPTAAPGTNDTQLATTEFVATALAGLPQGGVTSFNLRTGAVTLVLSDVTGAGGAPLFSPGFTGVPTSPTPAAGDSTGKIATTAFIQAAIAALPPGGVTSFNTRTGAVTLTLADVTDVGGAPIASPTFTGIPAAPTAAPGTNTTQLATTAFVADALADIPLSPVTSFNTRTGAVTLTLADVTDVGGAPLASPGFTGVPTAATAAPGTSTAQLATTAFVTTAVAGLQPGVASFNTRTGVVTLTITDITDVGGAPVLSPIFNGTPKAPTPAPEDNSTNLATTAFVKTAIAGTVAGVSSFNARTGVVTLELLDVTDVGGAPVDSPVFVGIPEAPTAAPGTNTTQLATTAFVQAGLYIENLNDVVIDGVENGQVLTYQAGQWINAAGGGGGGVSSFNTRTGAVTLTALDVSDALGYTPSAIPEAPLDTKLYGRQDGQWAEVNIPATILGPLESVTGTGSVSMIEQDGSGTGVAVLRAFQSSATVNVVEVGGILSFESASSVVSVAGITPVDGDVPLTASDINALPISGGIMTGGIDMASFALTGLAEPVNGSDAVNLDTLSFASYDPGEY